MKVLMFGWEFPPYNSGGLGTACHGLTKYLAKNGISIVFVLPRYYPNMKSDYVKLISTDATFISVNSSLIGYMTSEEYSHQMVMYGPNTNPSNMYGHNLFDEVQRYAEKAAEVAKREPHDIIHAHDWMTYQAAVKARNVSGKPLVVHVHATEFDRTGGNPNQMVYDLERWGMEEADAIITVSRYTKAKIMEHYGIGEAKIHVVHNGVDLDTVFFPESCHTLNRSGKVVLFLGRITLQKGPEYFLYAAKRCLEIDPSILFVYVGKGDMENFIIEKSAELGISHNVLFAGFLSGVDVDRIFQMADLYVMPSVSEPFGITPLEAMKNRTPVIISKQSGVSEILKNCLRVDFWDTDQLANKILAMLRYPSLYESLKEDGLLEVQNYSWEIPAKKCVDIYSKLGAV